MCHRQLQSLTTECKQAVMIRMRGCLLESLGYEAALVPRMVEADISVCAAILKGSPGRALRRILTRHDVLIPAADVFWGWVAQESTRGWLQLAGGRPQPGRGAPLMEWRVQAAEAGGWGGLLCTGDAPWFATFRMKVRQLLLQQTEEPVPQVTQELAQRVWMHSAKSQTKQAGTGKQNRSVYNVALAQLHQQREIVLVGSAARLLSRRQMVAAMQATVACGALPKVSRAAAVVDVTRATPVRDVVVDLCAGRQSMKGPARKHRCRYVAVDIEKVFTAIRGLQKTDVVLDLLQVSSAELVQVIASLAGVQVSEILLIWASVPCHTVSRLDPGNQNRTRKDGEPYTVHREYSAREVVRCLQEAVVVVAGTREPQTERAEKDDDIHETVLQALDAAFNLYGIHYAVENPMAQLGRRPVILAQQRSTRLRCHRLNYCQYRHRFAKDTNVWTTVAGWSPKGASGTGMCRAATDYCRGLCYHDKGCRKPIGEVNPDTGRWNHINVIGGPAWKAAKGSSKDELQNRVPALLLLEILQAM